MAIATTSNCSVMGMCGWSYDGQGHYNGLGLYEILRNTARPTSLFSNTPFEIIESKQNRTVKILETGKGKVKFPFYGGLKPAKGYIDQL